MEAAVGPEPRPARVRRMLTWALVAELVLIAATGIWLSFCYRPSTPPAWGGTGADGAGLSIGEVVRWVHRWVGVAALFPTGLALAALCLADLGIDRDRLAKAVRATAATALPLLLIASLLTGTLLPYEQLALWAVTVGTDLQGYGPVFGNDVRFVIVGGAEVNTDTIRDVLVVHAALLPISIVAALSVARRRPSAG